MNYIVKMMGVFGAVLLSTGSVAQALEIPQRQFPRPQTTNSVPHVQIGVSPREDLIETLLLKVKQLPGVALGATRISLPGAIGFQIDRSVELARPRSIVGGREFAHVHPDGSLHASLNPNTAKAAIQAGWAIAHPWSAQRDGWEGFVMIYTPLNEQEVDVVFGLVQDSYSYVTGRSLP